MTVSTIHTIRADGTPVPPIKTAPTSRDSTVRAALAIMVREAGTEFSHALRFVMTDGSWVGARVKRASA